MRQYQLKYYATVKLTQTSKTAYKRQDRIKRLRGHAKHAYRLAVQIVATHLNMAGKSSIDRLPNNLNAFPLGFN